MKTKSEQWLEALAWDNKTLGVPSIVSREIAKRAGVALRKAKPFKPAIRLPKGEKMQTIPKLKKELDRVFSIFIRSRKIGPYAMAECVTCKNGWKWRKMDAGHYVPRQDLATRWDERNVHAQCKMCNGFRGGEQDKMGAYIDATYGECTTAKIWATSKQKFRPTRDWMADKIKHYKQIIGEI